MHVFFVWWQTLYDYMCIIINSCGFIFLFHQEFREWTSNSMKGTCTFLFIHQQTIPSLFGLKCQVGIPTCAWSKWICLSVVFERLNMHWRLLYSMKWELSQQMLQFYLNNCNDNTFFGTLNCTFTCNIIPFVSSNYRKTVFRCLMKKNWLKSKESILVGKANEGRQSFVLIFLQLKLCYVITLDKLLFKSLI